MKKFYFFPLVLICFSLVGCKSLFNIGSDEFACQETSINGLKCMSVRELYKATDIPLNQINSKKNKNAQKSVGDNDDAEVVKIVEPGSQYDPSPIMDKPVPIRYQAKVMRIWIAPFEDEYGDLNAPGMVFTEIEPRRWNFGEGLVKRPMMLSPVLASQDQNSKLKSQPTTNSTSNPFGVSDANNNPIGNVKPDLIKK